MLLWQVLDHTQRLGCVETGGYTVLKGHKFFESTEWGSLHLQKPPELHPFLPANSEDSENLWSQYTVCVFGFSVTLILDVNIMLIS